MSTAPKVHMELRVQNTNKGHHKAYAAQVMSAGDGTFTVIAHWGPIGGWSQSQEKFHGHDKMSAYAKACNIIEEKLKKGYEPTRAFMDGAVPPIVVNEVTSMAKWPNYKTAQPAQSKPQPAKTGAKKAESKPPDADFHRSILL